MARPRTQPAVLAGEAAVGLAEPLEQVRQEIAARCRSPVSLTMTSTCRRACCSRIATCARPCGVNFTAFDEQVPDHLLQPLGIAGHRRHRGSTTTSARARPWRRPPGSTVADGVVDHGGEIDRLHVQAQLAGDDPRDVEDVLDDLRQRLSRCARGSRARAPAWRASAKHAAAQHAGVAEDGVERRPQLVRQRAEKLVLQPVRVVAPAGRRGRSRRRVRRGTPRPARSGDPRRRSTAATRRRRTRARRRPGRGVSSGTQMNEVTPISRSSAEMLSSRAAAAISASGISATSWSAGRRADDLPRRRRGRRADSGYFAWSDLGELELVRVDVGDGRGAAARRRSSTNVDRAPVRDVGHGEVRHGLERGLVVERAGQRSRRRRRGSGRGSARSRPPARRPARRGRAARCRRRSRRAARDPRPRRTSGQRRSGARRARA